MRAIRTRRLRLQPLGVADESLFCRLYGDAETMRHIGKPMTRALARASFRATLQAWRQPDGLRFFTIVKRQGRRPVGVCAVQPVDARQRSAQIGVMLARGARRRGFGLECAEALMEFAFRSLPIDAVWVQYRSSNSAAARLFERLGFRTDPAFRPRGGAYRIAIVRRSTMHDASPDRGKQMTGIIGILAKIGGDAALRHQDRAGLLAALRREPGLSAAQDVLRLQDIDAPLAREKMWCTNFPVKPPRKKPTPKKAPPKQPGKPAKRAPGKGSTRKKS